jgi:N-acylneuraminate cytidylyltransferase
MKIAVIPARGGSKRIPRKNIKEFCGKPIIAYSIEAALNSKIFDKVIVSTDDPEIAEVAKSFGAEIPFMRPENLSNDMATTIPVISHAVDFFQNQGHQVEWTCCLYATAPFVTKDDLSESYRIIKDSPDVKFLFSATSFSFPIQRAIYLGKNGEVNMFQPEHYSTRSQDLKEAFHDAGQFYWGRGQDWKVENVFFAPYSRIYKLPRNRVQDIDTLEDWNFAEKLFLLNKEKLA